MHNEHNICHRDLKPENFLFKTKNNEVNVLCSGALVDHVFMLIVYEITPLSPIVVQFVLYLRNTIMSKTCAKRALPHLTLPAMNCVYLCHVSSCRKFLAWANCYRRALPLKASSTSVAGAAVSHSSRMHRTMCALPQADLKIIDFGLSRFEDGSEAMTTRVGTPYYIAPEGQCALLFLKRMLLNAVVSKCMQFFPYTSERED